MDNAVKKKNGDEVTTVTIDEIISRMDKLDLNSFNQRDGSFEKNLIRLFKSFLRNHPLNFQSLNRDDTLKLMIRSMRPEERLVFAEWTIPLHPSSAPKKITDGVFCLIDSIGLRCASEIEKSDFSRFKNAVYSMLDRVFGKPCLFMAAVNESYSHPKKSDGLRIFVDRLNRVEENGGVGDIFKTTDFLSGKGSDIDKGSNSGNSSIPNNNNDTKGGIVKPRIFSKNRSSVIFQANVYFYLRTVLNVIKRSDFVNVKLKEGKAGVSGKNHVLPFNFNNFKKVRSIAFDKSFGGEGRDSVGELGFFLNELLKGTDFYKKDITSFEKVKFLKGVFGDWCYVEINKLYLAGYGGSEPNLGDNLEGSTAGNLYSSSQSGGDVKEIFRVHKKFKDIR